MYENVCRPRRAASALGSEQVVRVEPAQAPGEQPAAQEVSGCQHQIESVGRIDRVVDDRNGSKKLDDPDDIGQRGRLEQRDKLRDQGREHVAERLGERSEEHTSELQSLMRISYAVFCLKKKKQKRITRKVL